MSHFKKLNIELKEIVKIYKTLCTVDMTMFI